MNKEIFNKQKMVLDISFSPENLLYKEALTADIRLVFFHTMRSDKDSLVMSCPGDPERSKIRDPYATFAWVLQGFSFAQGLVILHFPEYMETYHNGDFINLTNNTSELRKAIESRWVKYKKEAS